MFVGLEAHGLQRLGAEAPQVVAEDHGFVADAVLVARLFDAAGTRQQGAKGAKEAKGGKGGVGEKERREGEAKERGGGKGETGRNGGG